MELRKKKTAEELRRRKGIDSFLGDIGKSAVEYGKGRLRDYPKEVASGWKTALGMQAKNIPESLEGISPVAESVGGLSISIPGALKQLGKSVVKVRKDAAAKLGPSQLQISTFMDTLGVSRRDVRKMAGNIRRTPEKVLEPLTEVKYKEFKRPGVQGQNVRKAGGHSDIELSPAADAQAWFHETGHSSSHASRGQRTLKGYLSDLLETSNTKAVGASNKAIRLGKVPKNVSYYVDQPIEQHARGVADRLLKTGFRGYNSKGKIRKRGNITQKVYNREFNKEAKDILGKLKNEWPQLYKQTLKDVAKSYKKEAAFKRYVKQGIQDKRPPGTFNEWFEGLKQGVKNPKSQDFLKGQNFSAKQTARIRKQASRIAEDEGYGGKVLEKKLRKSLKGMKPIKLLTKKKMVD